MTKLFSIKYIQDGSGVPDAFIHNLTPCKVKPLVAFKEVHMKLSPIKKTIINSMARTFFVSAWAKKKERQGKTFLGQELMDVAPRTPRYVRDFSLMYAGGLGGLGSLLVHLDNAAWADVISDWESAGNMACPLRRWEHPELEKKVEELKTYEYVRDFSQCLAGHGVWFDNHARFKIDVHHVDGVIWLEPRKALALSAIEKTIINGMARAFFVSAWVEKQERKGRSFAGQELMDVAPSTPRYARDFALMFAGGLGSLLVHLNNAAWADVRATQEQMGGTLPEPFYKHKYPGLEECAEALKTYGNYAANFGYCLAMMGMGTGVSWFDDHAQFEINVPLVEAYL